MTTTAPSTIGPADLSAAMGYRGNPGHPDVQEAIEDAIKRICAAGKAAGIHCADRSRHVLRTE